MIQDDRDAAIVVGGRKETGQTRWSMLLVVFMRIVAALWIAQGLSQWALVLLSPTPLFDHVSRAVGVAVAAFAVLDILAGVGLWLASAWGGVVWLLATLAKIAVAVLVPEFFSGGPLVAALDALLILLYLFLTWQAGREPERRSKTKRAASRLWTRSWSFLRGRG